MSAFGHFFKKLVKTLDAEKVLFKRKNELEFPKSVSLSGLNPQMTNFSIILTMDDL